MIVIGETDIIKILSECNAASHIMVKDNLLISDLIIASKHFVRLGVEIIWVNNYSDITTVLRQLHS